MTPEDLDAIRARDAAGGYVSDRAGLFSVGDRRALLAEVDRINENFAALQRGHAVCEENMDAEIARLTAEVDRLTAQRDHVAVPPGVASGVVAAMFGGDEANARHIRRAERARIRAAVEGLGHFRCEDPYYSCRASEDYPLGDIEAADCDCYLAAVLAAIDGGEG